MTKQTIEKLTFYCMIVAAVVFFNQAVFAQSGPAGSHDEIVKRLQAKLAAINNEVLSKEITPILESTGEADLGPKLVESFLSGVVRLDGSMVLFENPEAILDASNRLDGCFNELTLKGSLLRTYYDALSAEQRTTWSRASLSRVNTVSKPVIDKLRSGGFIRPAKQLESYKTICFKSDEDIRNQIQRQNNNGRLETMLENATERINAAKSPGRANDYGEYTDMPLPEDDMPGKENAPQKQQEKLPKLTWVQQIEGLALGTAQAEQVLPLCRLMAASTDSLMQSKRDELAKLRNPVQRSTSNNPYSEDYAEGDPSMYDMPGRGPSFRSNATISSPLPQVNVAGYLNSEIRMFMAQNIRPMIVSAKDTAEKDTLIKAWCALSEGADFSDTYLIILLEANTLGDDKPEQVKTSSLWLELLSVQSGYNIDDRIWSTATEMATVGRSDLCIQMCFNIGKTMLEPIRNCLSSPIFSPQAKVTLINAVQYIGDPDAAEFLIPLLVSNDKAIVSAAVDAIAAVGDSRAGKALVKGLENPRLAETIKDILKRMGKSSQGEIISMFKAGNPEVDKFCIDILGDGGDLNALPALAAVLRRYHNAPSTKDMPQAQKSEMLMLTMQAGLAIISRNMGKTAPALTVPTLAPDENGVMKLDYGLGTGDPANGGMLGAGPGMVRDDMMDFDYDSLSPGSVSSSGRIGADGTGAAATFVPIEKMEMQLDEVTNNGPFAWLEMVYMVAAKHVADSAELMEAVRTDGSGKTVGTTIRTERVDREFFRKVLNTSEEGLSAYLMDSEGNVRKGDVRKLKEQKERVTRSLGAYKKQENRIAQRKSAHDAFVKATTGVDPNAARTTGELGGETTTRQTTNPLGRRF